MINLNNNADYAFSKRKKGVYYGKPEKKTKLDYKDNKPAKPKRERVVRERKPRPKTKIVYVKEVPKPKPKKKKKRVMGKKY